VKIVEKSKGHIELKDEESFAKSELTSVSEKELKGKVGKGNASPSHTEGEEQEAA
jgi:hypothetical protein